ncbi:MAG: hypothetical protein P8Y37_08915 [Anaerolineales bacterium]
MKRFSFLTLTFLFLALAVVSCKSPQEYLKWIETPEQPPDQSETLKGEPFPDVDCTVIYGADGDQAFGGNNEDSPDPNTMIWFIPPEAGKYGMALVGYDDFVWQGGVNDQGLFFDGLAVSEKVHVAQGDKPRYPGSLTMKALEECADVSCVKRLFEEYHAYDEWAHQFMFGDARGDSLIIEPTMMIAGGAPFQVATNFYQSRTDINACRNCDRYWKARNYFEKEDPLSAELIRDILDEVHLEGDYPTQYSSVYDLKKGLIYLYFFHNYGNEVIFDLDEELAKGYHALYLPDLFPENPAYLEIAQPEWDQLAEEREKYRAVDLDPEQFSTYLGDYVGPEDYNPLFPYYSIAVERGELVLKMIPDKAWMNLEATSPTTFFHLSEMIEFEITFLPDDQGEVNQFIFRYLDHDYLFTRTDPTQLLDGSEAAVQESGPQGPELWAKFVDPITRFLSTKTFMLLAVVVGLILLQSLLGYFRSLLV